MIDSVDRVNLLLFQGAMPPFMKAQIVNAVAAYPSTGQSCAALPATQFCVDRARTAVYLAAISPRYQTEF